MSSSRVDVQMVNRILQETELFIKQNQNAYDPNKYVELRSVVRNKQSMRGVFAKTNLMPGHILGFYPGKIDNGSNTHGSKYGFTLCTPYRNKLYSISIGPADVNHALCQICEPSKGTKEAANVAFANIMGTFAIAVVVTGYIQKGEEIFVYYGKDYPRNELGYQASKDALFGMVNGQNHRFTNEEEKSLVLIARETQDGPFFLYFLDEEILASSTIESKYPTNFKHQTPKQIAVVNQSSEEIKYDFSSSFSNLNVHSNSESSAVSASSTSSRAANSAASANTTNSRSPSSAVSANSTGSQSANPAPSATPISAQPRNKFQPSSKTRRLKSHHSIQGQFSEEELKTRSTADPFSPETEHDQSAEEAVKRPSRDPPSPPPSGFPKREYIAEQSKPRPTANPSSPPRTSVLKREYEAEQPKTRPTANTSSSTQTNVSPSSLAASSVPPKGIEMNKLKPFNLQNVFETGVFPSSSSTQPAREDPAFHFDEKDSISFFAGQPDKGNSKSTSKPSAQSSFLRRAPTFQLAKPVSENIDLSNFKSTRKSSPPKPNAPAVKPSPSKPTEEPEGLEAPLKRSKFSR